MSISLYLAGLFGPPDQNLEVPPRNQPWTPYSGNRGILQFHQIRSNMVSIGAANGAKIMYGDRCLALSILPSRIACQLD